MYSKMLSLFAAVVLIAACSDSSANKGDVTGSGLGNSALSSSSLGNNGRNGGVAEPGSREDFEANVGDRVFFQYDRVELTPEARATLDRQAAWLKQYKSVTVTVEGHCDERGTREYNLGLGNRRSTAIKNYLTALGVPPSRVSIISYGKERPMVLGPSEDAWSQNRRGVTAVN